MNKKDNNLEVRIMFFLSLVILLMVIIVPFALSEDTASGDSGSSDSSSSEGSSDSGSSDSSGSEGSSDSGDSSSSGDSGESGSSDDGSSSGGEGSDGTGESSDDDSSSDDSEDDGTVSDDDSTDDGSSSGDEGSDDTDESSDDDSTSDDNEDDGTVSDDDSSDDESSNDGSSESDDDTDDTSSDDSTDDSSDDNTYDGNSGSTIDECSGVVCNDGNSCTRDYCNHGQCFYYPITNCTLEKNTSSIPDNDKLMFDPEYAKYMLLNEFEGDMFSIKTEKETYSSDELVLAKINAPEGSDVELSLEYDDYQQYIKIPKDKGYPLDYALPLPRNIGDGIYVVRAAIYYAGTILKTDTFFKIDNSGTTNTVKTYAADEVPLNEVKEITYDNLVDDTTIDVTLEDLVDEQAVSQEELEEKIASKEEVKKENVGNTPIEVGKSVRWEKNVNIENSEESDVGIQVIVDVPSSAKKVKVLDAKTNEEVSVSKEGSDLIITDDLESNEEKEYIVEFETDPAKIVEQVTKDNEEEWKKKVTISSDEEYDGEYEYKDVFSYTDIKESRKEDIRLYWTIDGIKTDVTELERLDLQFIDTNGDGLIDRLTWITPHLSTQEFEVIITQVASTGTGLSISLIDPDGKSFKSSDNIDFKYVVSYNRSLDVWCNLSIDGSVKKSVSVLDGQETIVNDNFTLSEGSHDWNVYCQDENSNKKTSSTDSFIVDLSVPTITLNNDDPDLSLMDSIDLLFTPTDNLASELNCSLMLNGIVKPFVIDADSGTEETVSLTSLDNGTYYWNISCMDVAGNIGTSDTQKFYIDTERNFSIVLNKNDYSLGEGGIYWITAPYDSEVTLVITTPKNTTITREYSGTYPVVDDIDFIENTGDYILDAYLNYQGAIATTREVINVKNTFGVTMTLSSNKITKGEEVKFTAYPYGGIGDYTYDWDFDDSSSSTSKSLNHKFDDYGTYTVELRVKDSKDNTVINTKTVSVEEKYALDIYVKDKNTNAAIKDATVIFDGERKETPSDGKVTYNMFNGEYSFFVRHDNYEQYFNYTLITKKESFVVYLNPDDNTVVLSSASTSDVVGDITDAVIDDEVSIIEDDGSEITSVSDSSDVDYNGYDLGSDEELKETIQFMISDLSVLIDSSEEIDSDVNKALGLGDKMRKAKTDLSRYNRDMFNFESNRRNLSEDNISRTKQDIRVAVKDIKDNLIVDAEVLSSDDFVAYPTGEDIKDISLAYLEYNNKTLKKKESDLFIANNIESQSLVTVSTNVYDVNLKTFAGKKKEITLVTQELEYSANLEDYEYIIDVPKEIAQDVSEITFETDFSVINPDPVVLVDPTENKLVSFYVKGGVEESLIKDIKSSLVLRPTEKNIQSGSKITGFAVFSAIGSIDNPVLVIEIVAIVILIIVYLIYQFELIELFKRKWAERHSELRMINGVMNDLQNCLKHGELENAEVVYGDVMNEYKKLSKEAKKKVHAKTIELHNSILLTRLNKSLETANEHIKNNNVENARSDYMKIQTFYKQLPKDMKSTVSTRCKEVFGQLSSMMG